MSHKTWNMGCASKSELGAFARRITALELPRGWRVRWTTSGSWCDRPGRIVYLDESLISIHRWGSREVVLHEIAHGIANKDEAHGELFYREYIALLVRYMRPRKDK